MRSKGGREHLPWTERGTVMGCGGRALPAVFGESGWRGGQEQHLRGGGDKCEQAEKMALDRSGVLVTLLSIGLGQVGGSPGLLQVKTCDALAGGPDLGAAITQTACAARPASSLGPLQCLGTSPRTRHVPETLLFPRSLRGSEQSCRSQDRALRAREPPEKQATSNKGATGCQGNAGCFSQLHAEVVISSLCSSSLGNIFFPKSTLVGLGLEKPDTEALMISLDLP